MSNKPGFFKRLKALSLPQKQLFATALCQRMLPNYALFSEVCEFGEPKVLSTVLDLLWQSQYDKKLKFNYDIHLQRLDENTPEPADFEAYGVYPAMDAAVALSTLLGGIQAKIEEDITNVSKLSSSTVANYIEAISIEELEDVMNEDVVEEFVFNHPVMQEEKHLQGMLLDVIEETIKITPEFIKELRKEIIDAGVSNIGISLQQ
ncbi:YjaG family protein [Shewanella sp. 5_MG-2023]|uniref:YjaG family protein n=1 Tax=Shewanella sp. 5_MG-2023 TaxID=3062656 RepID=UPI0026E38A4D|nr:YjaG family protein [Shewanella sp. 5_MG-2023]MDO6640107.1 YjaG family protein [Shewanella sp. 5_MG-2023]